MDGRACGSTLATSSFAPCLTTTFTTRHGELIETNAAERVIDKIHPSQVFSAPPCPIGIRGRNTLEVPTCWARCCCELTAEAWNRFSFPYPQRSSGSRAADIAAQWQRTPPNKDTLHQYELGQTRSERHVAVEDRTCIVYHISAFGKHTRNLLSICISAVRRKVLHKGSKALWDVKVR